MINEILTQDFQVTVVREFCKLHTEVAEDEAVRKACSVLMEYCKPVED
jgi:predicted transglutaminase-like protease